GDRLTIHLCDYVFPLDILRGGNTIIFNFGDDHALGFVQLQSCGHVFGQLLHLQTKLVRPELSWWIRRIRGSCRLRDLVRQFASRYWNLQRLSLSPNTKLNGLADFLFQDFALELRISRYRRPIDLGDDIKRSQIALVGWSVCFDRTHNNAAIDTLK